MLPQSWDLWVTLLLLLLLFFRGCHRQPLILFSFADYVVRLHVTERYIYIDLYIYIYIYNTGSYATVITLYLYVDIYLIQVHIYATIIILYNT